MLISGGSSLIPGFSTRVQKEVIHLAPPTIKVNVIAPPEHEYSEWFGGSVLASLPSSHRYGFPRL